MSEAAAPAARAGDRSGPLMLAGLSAAGRAVPAALLVSLPGLVLIAGFDHLAYGLGLLAGVVLAGLLIAPHVARARAVTITDALHARFGRSTALSGAVVVVLVALPLLAAEFTVAGLFAESVLGLPYGVAILAAFALGALAAVACSERTFGRLAAAAFVLVAAGLLVPLIALAFKAQGTLLPHVAYGEALAAIAALEEKLLENGLVDFDTFSAHATPFLRFSALDLLALVVSLALGTAVLPQLVSAFTAAGPANRVRFAGAWAALFVMIVMISVPALAAYAKLEIYRAMADATPLASLPAWLEAPLNAGLARIHGTSIHLLNEVAEAVRAGSGDVAAVTGALAHKAASAQQWAALEAETQEALLASARTLVAEPGAASAWSVYLTTVLPAAAAASGNEAATLTQASFVMEPAGLLLALPGLSGAPLWTAVPLAAGAIAAALIVASALIRSLLAVGMIDQQEKFARPWSKRALAVALGTGALAAAIAALRPDDLAGIVVSALSLGAAGLFPALTVGLAWKRATAAGVMAAIVLGAGVTLYYDVGIQAFPVSFYETWAPLSNAGEFAIENFRALETDAADAGNEQARQAALASLEALARGTPGRPGLANWAGIDSASGAIFGVPAGVLALILVSLLTGRRKRPHP